MEEAEGGGGQETVTPSEPAPLTLHQPSTSPPTPLASLENNSNKEEAAAGAGAVQETPQEEEEQDNSRVLLEAEVEQLRDKVAKFQRLLTLAQKNIKDAKRTAHEKEQRNQELQQELRLREDQVLDLQQRQQQHLREQEQEKEAKSQEERFNARLQAALQREKEETEERVMQQGRQVAAQLREQVDRLREDLARKEQQLEQVRQEFKAYKVRAQVALSQFEASRTSASNSNSNSNSSDSAVITTPPSSPSSSSSSSSSSMPDKTSGVEAEDSLVEAAAEEDRREQQRWEEKKKRRGRTASVEVLLEERMAELQRVNEELTEQCEQLVQQLRRERREHQELVGVKDKALEELWQSETALRAEIARLEHAERERHNQHSAAMQLKIQEYEGQIKDLSAELAAARDRNEAEIQAKQENINALTKKNNILEQRIRLLTSMQGGEQPQPQQQPTQPTPMATTTPKERSPSFEEYRIEKEKERDLDTASVPRNGLHASTGSRPPLGTAKLADATDTASPQGAAQPSIMLYDHLLAKKTQSEEAQRLRHQLSQMAENLQEHQQMLRLLQMQEKVLKEEIREMERSQKRTELDMEDLGYLKNVMVKFLLKPQEHESVLPVIARILQFSPEELQQIKETRKQQQGLWSKVWGGGRT